MRDELGPAVARGETLGGTGLSNPMKAFFGIERIKLKAQRVRGGYKVKGVLPWISNLGPDHRFGVVFELNDMPEHRVMAVINCAGEGVKTVQSDHFVALEGTRTFSVQLRDSFISDDDVLADPIDYYIPRIRAGFILLQSGMAFGLIRNCIQLMKQERTNLGLINKYIEKQPEDFDASLASLEDQVCARRRLKPGRATSGVSWKLGWLRGKLRCKPHHAMLHQGAKGYLSTEATQRRLRESYFVAIITPAAKQLKKMLAEMPVYSGQR